MRPENRTIELLSPAADLLTAKSAVNAGADAVYIGGPAFGARAKAGNSMRDIEEAARYAHRYAARCFMTLNTLVFDDELPQALALARRAYEAGVDALLIQDLGLLQAGLPPIELHASTQCHIDSVEKALFLQGLGFKRLVLARELSLSEIAKITKSVRIETETFIHGALCVCYSGQCYMSAYTNGRSGNRGECAQSCRLPYSLLNEKGEVLYKDRYLLSMKDFNAEDYIEDLIGSGVACLKIEGRLKDADYVRNVTAFYRKKIDGILARMPQKEASSQGRVRAGTEPDIDCCFHREYTSFNLSGERGDWAVFETPKAVGRKVAECVACDLVRPGDYGGLVMEVKPLSDDIVFSAGDGICYLDRQGNLQGNRIEKAEREGGRLFLRMQGPETPALLPSPHALVCRNRDVVFDKRMQTSPPERRIPVKMGFDAETKRFTLSDFCGNAVYEDLSESCFSRAENPLSAKENFERQLGKLGGTAYVLEKFAYAGGEVFFVPASALNAVRRALVEKLDALRERVYAPAPDKREKAVFAPLPANLDYRYNCANARARELYAWAGAERIEPAFETEIDLHRSRTGETLMVCKYCIRAQIGQCLKKAPDEPYRGNLFLRSAKHKFALHFDCAECRMEVRSCKQ